VKRIYIVAIIVIIGLMALHWLIDLRKQIQLTRKKKSIRRMTTNEVGQHTLLMFSFIILVITGFSLRFYDSWWTDLFFGWQGGFELRGLIHRVAAIAMVIGTVWHLLYLTSARGRRFMVDMFPTTNDFRQFLQMIGYNLNLRPDRPIFGRFSYIEKAEYWALVWGTVVMIMTGFLLWFDNLAVAWFPKGALDVVLIIHYYEAWLATLAILIWHMYSTVFSPHVYPMNPSWLDGRMPADMYEHEHGTSEVEEPEQVETGESDLLKNRESVTDQKH
jgi:cytochrome b subunit of formate dehydrogenase